MSSQKVGAVVAHLHLRYADRVRGGSDFTPVGTSGSVTMRRTRPAHGEPKLGQRRRPQIGRPTGSSPAAPAEIGIEIVEHRAAAFDPRLVFLVCGAKPGDEVRDPTGLLAREFSVFEI